MLVLWLDQVRDESQVMLDHFIVRRPGPRGRTTLCLTFLFCSALVLDERLLPVAGEHAHKMIVTEEKASYERSSKLFMSSRSGVA